MMKRSVLLMPAAALAVFQAACFQAAWAQTPASASCPIQREQLAQALRQSVKASGGPSNGGLDNNEWAAVVDRNGVVCAVAFSGGKATDQWPGSRAIAVEKANTANSFALDSFAISTANLWAPTQPGASLFGLQGTNPPAAQDLQAGSPEQFGTPGDPLVGRRAGGIVVFGGGLPLYDKDHRVVGGLGASGDTACADHNIAWRMRQALNLNNATGGPSPDRNDEIVFDVGSDGQSRSGWGHPPCGDNAMQVAREIGSGRVDVTPVPTTTGEAPRRNEPQPPLSNEPLPPPNEAPPPPGFQQHPVLPQPSLPEEDGLPGFERR